MALYSALLPVVELHQWKRNGDHPEDRTIHRINEGRVVQRHFSVADPKIAEDICESCECKLKDHGFLNTKYAIKHPTTCYIVCPGDYVMTHRDEKQRIIGYTTMPRAHVETFYELYKGPVK